MTIDEAIARLKKIEFEIKYPAATYTREIIEAVEQLKAERDAAVADLKSWSFCSDCKWYDRQCDYLLTCDGANGWEWRGVSYE